MLVEIITDYFSASLSAIYASNYSYLIPELHNNIAIHTYIDCKWLRVNSSNFYTETYLFLTWLKFIRVAT